VKWAGCETGETRRDAKRLLAIAGAARKPATVNGDEIVYQAVVARRLQWDNLVWQVPLLSLTAQAFLFTIALGNGTETVARCIAAGLSLIITFLSITLMARHRQAELTDAHWLEAYDSHHFGHLSDPAHPVDPVHGREFRRRRDAQTVDAGRLDKIIPMLPGFKTWIVGLAAFGVVAIAVFPLAIFGVLG
jgi:hypothetical protein